MIRVDILDEGFNRAYWNAHRTLPVEHLENPWHYSQRWRREFRCRMDPTSKGQQVHYIFDRDEDYTWFMLRWA